MKNLNKIFIISGLIGLYAGTANATAAPSTLVGLATTQYVKEAIATRQPTLVGSGTGQNIKTINSTSIMGSGDIAVQPTLVGSGTGQNIKTINSTSIMGSGNIAVQPTLVGSGNGQNIKTINNTNIMGSGNIAVQPTLTSSNVTTTGDAGVVKTVTANNGTVSVTRSVITNDDITDGTINQAKINGLSGALSAKQDANNIVITTKKEEYQALSASTTKYPSMAVVSAMVDAAAQDASTDIGLVQSDVEELQTGKQDKLVGSGTGQNIKTINSTSIMGSGNIAVQPTLTSSNVKDSGSGYVVTGVTAANGVVTVAKNEVQIPTSAQTGTPATGHAFIWVE